MNHFQKNPSELLKIWRQFRNDLLNINDDDEVLNKLVEWWKNAPIKARALDPYEPKTWPDPWELLYNGDFDENSVALGMCYTLHYIDWPCTLQLIQCNEINEIKLIIIVDDEHVLNYSYGKIDHISDISHCEIKCSWESNTLTR